MNRAASPLPPPGLQAMEDTTSALSERVATGENLFSSTITSSNGNGTVFVAAAHDDEPDRLVFVIFFAFWLTVVLFTTLLSLIRLSKSERQAITQDVEQGHKHGIRDHSGIGAGHRGSVEAVGGIGSRAHSSHPTRVHAVPPSLSPDYTSPAPSDIHRQKAASEGGRHSSIVQSSHSRKKSNPGQQGLYHLHKRSSS